MLARPFHRSPTPIQLIPVPVKVTTAWAPATFVRAALPPLLASLPFVYQVPLYVILGSVSSTRATPPLWAMLNDALTINKISKRKKVRKQRIILFLLRNTDAYWSPNDVCRWEGGATVAAVYDRRYSFCALNNSGTDVQIT